MDVDQAKLFVGGISWETSEDTLKDHFEKYGDVVSAVIVRDRNTGSTRGFGFVSFSELSAVEKALQERHDILGRTVEVKKAVPRGEHHHQNTWSNKNHSSNINNNSFNSSDQSRTKKIFVGGLAPSLTEGDFKNYFEKFGNITDVVVMYDSVTHRPRGFGFITFDSEEAVEGVMQKNFHELNNKLVEVKRAIPKDGGYKNNIYSNNGGYGEGVASGGGGSVFGSYGGEFGPTYGHGYGIYQGYGGQLPFWGYGTMGDYPYGGGGYHGLYPMGVYGGGVGYGAHVTTPRSPWNGQGMVGVRRSPAPYGSPAAYPGYANDGMGGGGYMAIAAGGFTGVMGAAYNGKWNHYDGHLQAPVSRTPATTPPHAEGRLSGDDSSGIGRSHGMASDKLNQRGPEGQFRPHSDRLT